MKIPHRKSQTLLVEYAAGELDRAAHLAMTAHLERCQICRQDLAEIHHIRALMRSLAAQPFPNTSSSATLTDLETIFATQELAISPAGRQYRSIPEMAQEQRQPRRKLLSLLAAILLALVLICSTALVLNLELRGHTGPTTQQYSTPTVIPHGGCTTSTPPLATPTPTPTEAGTPTPTPQTPPLTPTPFPQGCPQSVLPPER